MYCRAVGVCSLELLMSWPYRMVCTPLPSLKEVKNSSLGTGRSSHVQNGLTYCHKRSKKYSKMISAEDRQEQV